MNNTNRAIQYGVNPDYKALYYKMKARGAQDMLNGTYVGLALAILCYLIMTCSK